MTTTRFMRKGITKFYFAATIADKTAPDASSELSTALDITPQIHTVNGFSFANTPIKTPDMASTFTSEIPGEDVAEDSGMEMYELKGGTDSIHDGLTKGTAGFMVIFYAGMAGASPAAGDKCDVWPCTVSSNARMYTADNQAAMYHVKFSMTATPAQGVTVVA